MVTYNERARFKSSWPLWRLILTGLNLLALALSVILSWHYLKGGPMIGCGGGSPCEQVLSSRWSVIAGFVPVSGLAMGVYLAMLVAGFFTGPATEEPTRRLAWGAMLVLAGSVAGSAVWFTILQKWIIGDFCPYCMTTHITGFLLAVLIILRAMKDSGYNPDNIPLTGKSKTRNITAAASGRIFRPLPATILILTGLIMAAVLAVYQAGFHPAAGYSGNETPDDMPVIDYHSVPLAGSPDAPYTVTLLFDYQCSHCQQIHFMLNDAIRSYSGRLAFALCPAPLDSRCNPYIPQDADAFKNSCELARTGLVVWLADRKAFPAFENWMFSFESGDRWRPRSPEAARAKAVELVGREKFAVAWSDPWIEQYLQTCVRIYGQTIHEGVGGIPKMIFGSHWVIPEAYNSDDLVRILRKSLAVPAP